jgi:tetratricopeptide (TPR) repeat protein
MFVVILVVGLNMVRPGPGPVPNEGGAAGTAAAAPGAAPDISQMTPIEAADRLFNRVMTSVSSGDSLAAQQFMPMAIAAYQRARPLNLDGLFHLSMLNRTAGNYEAALDNAVELLEQDANHLLGLAAAAEASVELEELDEAERYYRKILEIFPSERGSGREEYQMHATILEQLEAQAEAFLAGR